MFFTRRPLLPDEPDYERLFAWLLPAMWAGAQVFLFVLRLRFPPCPLRTLTGIPCPGCGGTRATLALAAGDVGRAFVLNPGWALACVASVIVWIYALGVVFFKLPRFRDDAGKLAGARLPVIFTGALLANWFWVFYCHRFL